MIRLLQLAGKETPIDIGDLGFAIADWDRDQVRVAWAYAYYGADSTPRPGAAASIQDAE